MLALLGPEWRMRSGLPMLIVDDPEEVDEFEGDGYE